MGQMDMLSNFPVIKATVFTNTLMKVKHRNDQQNHNGIVRQGIFLHILHVYACTL